MQTCSGEIRSLKKAPKCFVKRDIKQTNTVIEHVISIQPLRSSCAFRASNLLHKQSPCCLPRASPSLQSPSSSCCYLSERCTLPPSLVPWLLPYLLLLSCHRCSKDTDLMGYPSLQTSVSGGQCTTFIFKSPLSRIAPGTQQAQPYLLSERPTE